MKKILSFFLFLLPWFLLFLIPFPKEFYQSLTLPFFTPSPKVFQIVWTIIYFSMAISIYQTTKYYSFKEIPPSYGKSLLLNYGLHFLFLLFFFVLKHLFLSFTCCVAIFLANLSLYQETTKIEEKNTKYLNLYTLWSLFSCILSFTTYILNTR